MAAIRGGILADDELAVDDPIPFRRSLPSVDRVVALDAYSFEVVKVQRDLRVACFLVVQRDFVVDDVSRLDDAMLCTLLAQSADRGHVRTPALLPRL